MVVRTDTYFLNMITGVGDDEVATAFDMVSLSIS